MKLIYLISLSTLLSLPLNGQIFFEQSQILGVTAKYGYSNSEGGGGISTADFNGDGLSDLSFSTAQGSEPMFYTNEGTHFQLVNPNFIDHDGEAKQIMWVDYDADGDKDIYITSENSLSRLYENTGNLNFIDVTAAVGLNFINGVNYGANFGDLDFDGNLELYVTSYGNSNKLFSYNPTTQVFDNITSTSLIGNGQRLTFDCVFFDSELDGDLDIYVINDKVDFNTLYMNIGNNVFIDISVPSMTDLGFFSMNAGVGDFNLDGLQDIYVTSQYNSALLKNLGGNVYEDVAMSADVEIEGWSWTGNFIDFDNDNDLDLYACVELSDTDRPNPFFVNNGNETFTEPFLLSDGLSGIDTFSSMCNAIADFDNNGLMDIVTYKAEQLGTHLFMNHTSTDAASFKLDLKGVASHPEAWGAFIEVHFTDGTLLTRHKHCSESFLSQNSEFIHFGVAENQTIDFVKIKWPSSSADEIIQGSNILLNGTNTITEGQGLTESVDYKICIDSGELLLNPLTSLNLGTVNELEYSGQTILSTNAILQSELEIYLNKGFHAVEGSIFEAKIDICDN